MARDILAEAERAAQDIVASAVKIKAEADRALDEARSKAVCIQKRAQAALALAENIAKSRRMIDTFGEYSGVVNNNGYSRGHPFRPELWAKHRDRAGSTQKNFRAHAQLRVTCCKIRITTTQCVIDNSKKAIAAPAPDGGRLASKALIPLVP